MQGIIFNVTFNIKSKVKTLFFWFDLDRFQTLQIDINSSASLIKLNFILN